MICFAFYLFVMFDYKYKSYNFIGNWVALRKLLGESFANDERIQKLMGINRDLFKEKLYNKLISWF